MAPFSHQFPSLQLKTRILGVKNSCLQDKASNKDLAIRYCIYLNKLTYLFIQTLVMLKIHMLEYGYGTAGQNHINVCMLLLRNDTGHKC